MEVVLLGETSKEYLESQAKIVATAAKLSRFKGDVLEVYNDLTNNYDENIKFIQRVINMGHDSITDHDYVVIALKDVSALVEQIIIEQRFCSFTIKSRREVDFSKVGYYIPNFYDKNNKLMDNNLELQDIYIQNMEYLFYEYNNLLKQGVPKEDARYILPYCFNSNIVMGLDVHALKDLIIDLTKGKNSNITELKELGLQLYQLMEERCHYVKKVIDREKEHKQDGVEEYLRYILPEMKDDILEEPKLLNCTNDIDDTLFISSIMRIYGLSYDEGMKLYNHYVKYDEDVKLKLIKLINKEKKDLSNINFSFQLPISLAVLTHLTRHRTHNLSIPDFVPIKDLSKYMIPESYKKIDYNMDLVFNKNISTYKHFKQIGVRDEDLVYFYLAGNMLNVVTNMDGKTLEHILRLRCCNKTQWETRNLANDIRRLVSQESKYFASILGASCDVDSICYEGRECCGKIKILKKNKE